jgi:hypothetical protein
MILQGASFEQCCGITGIFYISYIFGEDPFWGFPLRLPPSHSHLGSFLALAGLAVKLSHSGVARHSVPNLTLSVHLVPIPNAGDERISLILLLLASI